MRNTSLLKEPDNNQPPQEQQLKEVVRFSRFSHHYPLLNFGVVDHGIYRSSLLGKWGLFFLQRHLRQCELPFPKTILYLHSTGPSGIIPRIGSFALDEKKLQSKFGHHFFYSKNPNEDLYLNGHNPYRDQRNIENFYRILNLILDQNNHPLLFHCIAGRHRTGMVALALRYLKGGEWIDGPKKKVFIFKYRKFFYLNPAQYEYYLHCKYFFRRENLDFIEEFFKKDPMFKVYQQKFLSIF